MENLGVDLSIIVPCYNVSKYIQKCINSIIAIEETFFKWELIIINDGSTDMTLEICESISKENLNKNIKIISQENKGLGISRNVGINHSNGKYLWFVDGDDYIDSSKVLKMLEYSISNDLDVLWFDHELVNENYNLIEKPKEDLKDTLFTNIYVGSIFLKEVFKKSCMVCMFLFKKQHLLDNNLTFEHGVYFEDILFTPICIDKAERVSLYNEVCYYYLIREDSIMRSRDKAVKRINDGIYASYVLKKYVNVAREKKYFVSFSNQLLIYNLRRAAKINKIEFTNLYLKAVKYKLIPVSCVSDIVDVKLKLSSLLINLLGLRFYIVARLLK